MLFCCLINVRYSLKYKTHRGSVKPPHQRFGFAQSPANRATRQRKLPAKLLDSILNNLVPPVNDSIRRGSVNALIEPAGFGDSKKVTDRGLMLGFIYSMLNKFIFMLYISL